MKKILLGLGYLTWSVCNITVLYGIGLYVKNRLINPETVTDFLLSLSLGLIVLMLIAILSILILGLITMIFGGEKGMEKVKKAFLASTSRSI